MARARITGTRVYLEDFDDRESVYKLLDKRFKFRIDGYYFAEAYRQGRWDGYVHLVRKVRNGGLWFPVGLWHEARKLLVNGGFEFSEDDERRTLPEFSPRPKWIGPPPRDYQNDAVEAALHVGGGVLNLPIRAGKTLTAGRIIYRLAKRTLFVVPSDMLLRQTKRALEAMLEGVDVGVVGGGEWQDEGGVVVATVQSLTSSLTSRRFRKLSRGFEVVFFDEVHHLGTDGEAWREAALAIDARYKFGLSATVETDHRKQQESGAIWLRGICGPTLYEIEMSDLIRRGYLVKPTIRFVRHGAPDLPEQSWTPTTYRDGIAQNAHRNSRIVAEATRYAEQGHRVLIDCARVGHARKLAYDLSAGLGGSRVGLLLGTTPVPERERVVAAFREGAVQAIVSTIMGEGVDVPELSVVINAEGGKADVSTVQRLRNLTKCEGKTKAIVVEMIDTHHPTFADWTRGRLEIYKSEPAFSFYVAPKDG